MPDSETDADKTPTLIPSPNLELIKQGGRAGQEELANTLRNIIDAVNSYMIRKGL